MAIVRTISLQFNTTDGIKLPPVSFTVQDGKDAYETWLELPGNEGKSKQDYLDYLRYTIPVVQTTGNLTGSVMSQDITTKELNKRVPITLTINGKPLNSNIVLSPSDIGTYPTATIDGLLDEKVNLTDSRLTDAREWLASTMPQAEAEAGTATARRAITSLRMRQATAAYTYSKAEVDSLVNVRVPTSRTINGKPLSANVTITLEELGGVSSSGEVSSAVKLKTPRTINGTAFDGTANITTSSWGTSRNLVIGNATKSVNGSGNVTWTLAEIGAVSNTDARLSDSREWTAATMSQAEAEAGTATTRRAVTSLVLRQAVSAYALSKAESNTQAGLKVDKTAIVQVTGTSTTNIMSQKATTDALATKAPSSHTHPWNQVTDKPSSATRWPTFAEVTGKPTNYPTTWESVAAKPAQATRWPTLAEISACEKITWNAVVKQGTWSRIMHLNSKELGSKAILTVGMTRDQVVVNARFLISGGHSNYANIVQLGSHDLTQIQLRLVSLNQNDIAVELLDTGVGAAAGSEIVYKCEVSDIYGIVVTHSTFQATTGTPRVSCQTKAGVMKVNNNDVVTMDVLDARINALPRLLSGTAQPTAATGKAGDWYIVY